MNHSRTKAIVLTGDILVLLAFVILGRITHDMTAASLRSGAITAVSLVIPWVITVFAMKAWPMSTWRPFITRSLAAWLIAAPLGLMLRAFLLGSNAISLPFMTTTLLLGGAFILGWRLLYALLLTRKTQPTP